ncbi:MAG: Octaprenyl diphosphate synthase (EC / Dimethylallyltransferase (EC / (2E,6E)-farnesyl diphosphate synthase (EC / Geranylgeranyl pyrophosphate synthetase (EC [uncultured Sulfurovum sp.]|uniref:Octaprenyl diphosphate synthase -farnesyl diphosphate synthase ))) n=1 Tax=uncultured Sulfurovum sp. TaxID=269237 RepID=A0A6S6SCT6_9BACT|nr:MAG: Octaprenyl diphosphate synthase (EC / Dimethylallyltransferase (EC / (2E,6E)-farnesyl diphosphate synthase (EC / Geranylgeranyl pyrophosphate synthetase (EC [uncultured Sulfurovum sp.]
MVIDAVERKIEQYISELGDQYVFRLYKNIPHGKRLRTKLILKIAGSSLKVIKTAATVEMIHAASLLHDDVIDDADTRRGQASVNASEGNKTAIMMGDILYSKAFFELNSVSSEVAKVISNAVVQLSLGELADVELSKSFHTNREAYLKMLYQKTASLMEASAESAAILAGKNRKAYRQYGHNLGLAFQMIDDILDITEDSKTLGKPALHDFVEGKVTLPYIYLYEKLADEDREFLVSLHRKRLSEEEALWIKSAMKKHHIIEKSYNEAKVLIDEAIESMELLGEHDLSNIAKAMIERKF